MSFGKIKYTVGHILLNLFFLVICAAALIPILYAVSLSLGNGSAAISSGLSFFRSPPHSKITG